MDWVGSALNVIGLYLLPKRRMAAMYVFVLSNVFFIGWSAYNRTWSILILQIILLILNIRTIHIWNKQLFNYPST